MLFNELPSLNSHALLHIVVPLCDILFPSQKPEQGPGIAVPLWKRKQRDKTAGILCQKEQGF